MTMTEKRLATTPDILRNQLLHPSGGLVWHLRAWQNLGYWHPLQQAVEHWLQTWFQHLPSHCRALVLIGPSAGWTLPLPRLKRFSEIIAFEPDILARQLLKQRLPTTSLRFDSTDVFSSGGMEYLRDRYGLRQSPHGHAILFCNVLGQLSPEDTDHAEHWCNALATTLAPCHWASYHDLFSTRKSPARAQAPQEFSAGTSLETILSAFWRESEIEICDHGTSTFGQHTSFASIPWRLRKNQWHLVQWVSHFANATS